MKFLKYKMQHWNVMLYFLRLRWDFSEAKLLGTKFIRLFFAFIIQEYFFEFGYVFMF